MTKQKNLFDYKDLIKSGEKIYMRGYSDCKNYMTNKILTEINKQDVWLSVAGYNAYNVDLVLDSIRKIIKESEVK